MTSLAEHFGAKSGAARTAIPALVEALRAAKSDEARRAFQRWRALYSALSKGAARDPGSALSSLGDRYGVRRAQPAQVIFAIHTYCAILLKRIATSVAGSCDDDDELFTWVLSSWTEGAADADAAIARALTDFDPGLRRGDCNGVVGVDVMKPIYEALLPGPVRRALGEYYTPGWLAEHMLRELDYNGDPSARILDPACGSGAFLLPAIRRVRARLASSGSEAGDPLKAILRSVIGVDRSPLAVLAAKTNYLLAVNDLLGSAPRVQIPVYLADSILDRAIRADGSSATSISSLLGRFDFIAGNPPWINWASLSASYRRAVAPLFRRYDLFPHKGLRARTGAAMDDLSALLTYVSLDRYLKRGGRLGFVVTQSLFKTEGGGEGFRRFALADGEPIRVSKVADLSAIQPFEGATSRTATVVLEKGAATAYPVAYSLWCPRAAIAKDPTYDEAMSAIDVLPRLASPICSSKPTSPWIAASPSAMAGAERCLGPSAYTARYGTHCHASGIYWVERIANLEGGQCLVRNLGDAGKKKFPIIERRVDAIFLHRLARGRDVRRWSVTPGASILLPQDAAEPSKPVPERELSLRFPATHAYFRHFEADLRARSGYKKFFRPGVDPFYSVYNVGAYTFARYKIVWREVARDLRCAVINGDAEPAVPDHTLVSVAAGSLEEAHYLCAALSSSPANFIVLAYVTLHPGPHVLRYVRVPRFDPADPVHKNLASLSIRCHEAALSSDGSDGSDGKAIALPAIERDVDEAAARLWGLSSRELDALRDASAEGRIDRDER